MSDPRIDRAAAPGAGSPGPWRQLVADRRKFGMICACFALAMLFWARLIVIADMPRTAIAEPPSIEGPSARGSSDLRRSHNLDVARAPGVLETTPKRDPFALRPTSSATTQRSVAE